MQFSATLGWCGDFSEKNLLLKGEPVGATQSPSIYLLLSLVWESVLGTECQICKIS